jgi:hypothetical protein
MSGHQISGFVEIRNVGFVLSPRQALPPFIKEDRGGFWDVAMHGRLKISLNPSLEKREVHGGNLDTSYDIEFQQTPALARRLERKWPGSRASTRVCQEILAGSINLVS